MRFITDAFAVGIDDEKCWRAYLRHEPAGPEAAVEAEFIVFGVDGLR